MYYKSGFRATTDGTLTVPCRYLDGTLIINGTLMVQLHTKHEYGVETFNIQLQYN